MRLSYGLAVALSIWALWCSGMSVPKPVLKSWPMWYVGMASNKMWGSKKFGAVEAKRLCIKEREASLTGRMGFHLEGWSTVKWGPDVEAVPPFPVLSFGRDLILDQAMSDKVPCSYFSFLTLKSRRKADSHPLAIPPDRNSRLGFYSLPLPRAGCLASSFELAWIISHHFWCSQCL